MPHEVTLRGPVYTFECYGVHEAKQLGLIDSWEREGSHAPVSTVFEQGEGKLLADWVALIPDALLIATGRYQITVYRPKSRVLLVEDEDEENMADAALEGAGNVVPFEPLESPESLTAAALAGKEAA